MIRIEEISNVCEYKRKLRKQLGTTSDTVNFIDIIESQFNLDRDRNYGYDQVEYFLQYLEDNYDYSPDEDEKSDIHKYFHGYMDDLKALYVRDDTYEYYNPNPHGATVGDCVKRAFTKATGLDYMEIQRQLNRIKREIGANHYSSNAVYKEFIARNNFKPIKFPVKRGEPRMNGHRFAVEHPHGTYILNMAKHLTCCKDGVIYDSWDCRNKCVYNAYEYLG